MTTSRSVASMHRWDEILGTGKTLRSTKSLVMLKTSENQNENPLGEFHGVPVLTVSGSVAV